MQQSPPLSPSTLQQWVIVQIVVQFSTYYDNLKFIIVFKVCLRPPFQLGYPVNITAT